MDYVREELLRQQKLLAALMSGGAKKEENLEDKPEGTLGTGESPWGQSSGTRVLEEETGGTVLETQGFRARVSGPDQRELDFVTALRPSSKDETRREETPGGSATAGSRARGALPSIQSAVDWEWPAVVRRRAAGSTDAQVISRAIQRDARRYDGGFTIY